VILEDSDRTSEQAARIVGRRGVIAFRTDTFYGLGADPFSRSAVLRIKILKERADNKPILIVISDLDQLDRIVVETSLSFKRLAKTFWPGALTIIGKASRDLPAELTAGSGTIGVRLPDDAKVRALVRACGGALTATSANPSGRQPARTAKEVEKYFADDIDVIVDAGRAKTDQASTVVDAISDSVTLVRDGAIPWSAIQAALTN